MKHLDDYDMSEIKKDRDIERAREVLDGMLDSNPELKEGRDDRE